MVGTFAVRKAYTTDAMAKAGQALAVVGPGTDNPDAFASLGARAILQFPPIRLYPRDVAPPPGIAGSFSFELYYLAWNTHAFIVTMEYVESLGWPGFDSDIIDNLEMIAVRLSYTIGQVEAV